MIRIYDHLSVSEYFAWAFLSSVANLLSGDGALHRLVLDELSSIVIIFLNRKCMISTMIKQ
jgi:hypothetical protein